MKKKKHKYYCRYSQSRKFKPIKCNTVRWLKKKKEVQQGRQIHDKYATLGTFPFHQQGQWPNKIMGKELNSERAEIIVIYAGLH